MLKMIIMAAGYTILLMTTNYCFYHTGRSNERLKQLRREHELTKNIDENGNEMYARGQINILESLMDMRDRDNG